MEARRSSIASDRVRSTVPGPDPDRLVDINHEYLAVADASGAGGAFDGLNDILGHAVLDHHLDLHLGEKVDHIFGAAVELRVALLPAEALHFADGQAGNADVVQRILHVIQLERL